jgi:hypothetical protein
MSAIKAVLIAVAAGFLATCVGAVLYASATFGDVEAADLLLLATVALSGWAIIVPCGSLLGLLALFFVTRLGVRRASLPTLVLATFTGGAVGYFFARRSPHLSPVQAAISVALGWLTIAGAIVLVARLAAMRRTAKAI